MEPDLSVELTGLRLKNPIIAAAGTFGYGVEFTEQVDLNRLGGIVTKGISLEPIAGAAPPRLCETPSGMLNAVGLQNIGVEAFIKEKLPQLRQFDTAIIVNVFGETVEEYVAVIGRLEDAEVEGLHAYELNISCPNVKRGGVQFGANPELLTEVVAAAKAAAKSRPLWVKLTPGVTDIAALARMAREAGADALCVANTWPGMDIDPVTRRSRIGSASGGLSGPAIRPLSVRAAYEVCQAVDIPVIGIGGIMSGADVAQYLVVGARAVQIGTANFVQPSATTSIIKGVSKFLKTNNIAGVTDLCGTFIPE